MTRFSASNFENLDNRQVRLALIFGVTVLTINFAISAFFPNGILLGNLFIFIAACSLSFGYTALTLLLTSTFSILLGSQTWSANIIFAIQTAVLALTCSLTSNKSQRIPASVSACLVWLFVLTPIVFAIQSFHLTHIPSAKDLILTSFNDIVFIALADCLLLNRNLWNIMTNKFRQINLMSFTVRVLLCTTLVIIASLTLFFEVHTPLTVIGVTAFAVFASLVAAYSISTIVEKDSNLLLRNQMLNNGVQNNFCRRFDIFNNSESDSIWDDSFLDVLEENRSVLGQGDSKLGVCTLDNGGKVLFINQTFRDSLNVKSPHPMGQNIADIEIDNRIADDIIKLIKRSSDKRPHKIELKIEQLNNKTSFFEVSTNYSSNLQNVSTNESSEGIILKVKDITKQRTLENHLVRTQKLSSLTDIIRGMVHSFNNTLTSITGLADAGRLVALHDQPSKDVLNKLTETLDSIISECDKVSKNTKHLNEYIEERNSIVLPVNLKNYMASYLNFFEKLTGENYPIKFTSSDEEIVALCDSQLVTQAIVNLVTNSKESYGEQPGEIEINLCLENFEEEIVDLIPGGRAGKFCCIRISDHGCGMNSEELAKCCDTLFTTKTDTLHNGLGLAMVYGIMRSLEGFLAIESQLGKGTTISLYFPQGECADQSKAEDKTDIIKLSNNSEAILVVDDDESVRNVLTIMLEKLGYQVTACSSGEEAINELNKKTFNLLLADFAMPNMTGLELINEVQPQFPNIKMLIMTAYSDQKEFGNIPVLYKPFDIRGLSKLVHDRLSDDDKGEVMRDFMSETISFGRSDIYRG